MTKLDETFVKAALEKHPEAAYFINTLAEEVRRLETLEAKTHNNALDIAACVCAEKAGELDVKGFRGLADGCMRAAAAVRSLIAERPSADCEEKHDKA